MFDYETRVRLVATDRQRPAYFIFPMGHISHQDIGTHRRRRGNLNKLLIISHEEWFDKAGNFKVHFVHPACCVARDANCGVLFPSPEAK